MKQTGQSMTVQSFDTFGRDSSSDDPADSRCLESSAEAAVSHALAASIPDREFGIRGETAGSWDVPDHERACTLSSRDAITVGRLPPLNASAPPMATFLALQEWEGYVASIGDDAFVARLVDLTAGATHESEEATIPLDEISHRDAANMEVGSIFRWVIGYERSPGGTQKRVSQIVFRDLPRMTEGDFRAGRMWAEKIAPALNP
ncbi:MAG: hypothetical protein OXF07_16385 [Rhodobacter sp.]|nr:hypothetical protein [Rhodobacter sp.]